MNGLLNIFKPAGITPFQQVQKLKESLGIDSSTKVGYAGRLDPMASGVLLLMIGESCKNRDQYQKWDKSYKFDLVLGISTDSLDLLGVLTQKNLQVEIPDQVKLQQVITQQEGNVTHRYPLYSSFTLKGEPLYKLAREGQVDDANRPTYQTEVYSLKLVNSRSVKLSEILTPALTLISEVRGDFRQDQIIDQWEQLIDSHPDVTLPQLSFEADVKSGTYVRTIGEQIGAALGVPSVVNNIVRTKAGEFHLNDSIKL